MTLALTYKQDIAVIECLVTHSNSKRIEECNKNVNRNFKPGRNINSAYLYLDTVQHWKQEQARILI